MTMAIGSRWRQPRVIAGAALRAARNARRPARLLRLHRLHRARRDGDCRRRLGRRQPQRRPEPRGPHLARRRRRVLADPARSHARGNRLPARPRRSFGRGRLARHGPQRRRQAGAGRTQGGGRQLPDARGIDARSQNAGGGSVGRARRRVRRGGGFHACWRGSISSSATASASATPTTRSAAWSVAEPDKLAGNVGLGPRFLVSETSLRATGLLQPGSLVRWIYRVKLPDNAADERAATQLIDSARAALPEAGWWIRSRANASPQLERTISRFTQFLTLVGLAALLVGGVGVANAVKSHIDRRRDVIASFKALGATGRDVFTIYLTQVIVLAGIGSIIGLAAGAALPFVIVGLFGKLLPLPVIPALHLDELALSFIYGLLDRARLRTVAARPGARRAGRRAVPRGSRPRMAPPALEIPRLDGGRDHAVDRGRDRPCLRQADRGGVRRLVGCGVRAAARRRRRPDGAGAPAAAIRHHHAAAGDCQHLPSRRADALGGDVAGPRSRRPRHHHPDRRQSAAPIPGGAAGPRALVLFHRHPDLGSRSLRRLPQADRAAIDGGGRADAARTHRRGPRRQGRRTQADAGYRMGAAERPRPDLYRRHPQGLEGRRGRLVALRTTAARRWSRWRRRSPTG